MNTFLIAVTMNRKRETEKTEETEEVREDKDLTVRIVMAFLK